MKIIKGEQTFGLGCPVLKLKCNTKTRNEIKDFFKKGKGTCSFK